MYCVLIWTDILGEFWYGKQDLLGFWWVLQVKFDGFKNFWMDNFWISNWVESNSGSSSVCNLDGFTFRANIFVWTFNNLWIKVEVFFLYNLVWCFESVVISGVCEVFSIIFAIFWNDDSFEVFFWDISSSKCNKGEKDEELRVKI